MIDSDWMRVIGLSAVLLGSCGYLFGCAVARWRRADAERRQLRAAICALMVAA